MTPSFEEDRQLISKCLSGDRNAWETLVRRFSNLVYHTVRSSFLAKQAPFSKQDLEDLHNTVFLGFFEQGCAKLKLYQGKNGCTLASWIRIVTVRMVLNHLRRKGVDAPFWEKKKTPVEELAWLRGENQEPLALMEAVEREKLVHEAMESLAPKDLLFSKLHFDQGLPLEEVAEVLKISINNASVVKHRIIERLKSYLVSRGKYGK
jgi:RNA polymerase sigma-70 factor (ECF subfamily)